MPYFGCLFIASESEVNEGIEVGHHQRANGEDEQQGGDGKHHPAASDGVSFGKHTVLQLLPAFQQGDEREYDGQGEHGPEMGIQSKRSPALESKQGLIERSRLLYTVGTKQHPTQVDY